MNHEPGRDLREQVRSRYAEAPDACTLPTAERPLRAADFAALFKDAVHVERPEPTRLHLDLRPGAEVAARAAGLAAAETECCSFFTFALTATGGALSLDVTVPAAPTAILDALAGLNAAAARS
jgi:hypothetical protein